MSVHQELIPRVSVEGAVYPSLRGKAVLITGGGSGIGASLVEHFCAQGARVGFIELNPDYAEETARIV
jgi:NAD(P)-dependent dehydrogenase (short-subunit alcohol dehydrogenase family)